MPIPSFDKIMFPLLKYLADREEHTTTELLNYLSVYFKLTEDEINQRMLNQNRGLFYDRLNWAKVYLRKAKLIESVARSTVQITMRGLEVLEDVNLTDISSSFLMQFPEFVLFVRRDTTASQPVTDGNEIMDNNFSPLEIMDKNFGILSDALSSDLLEKIMCCSPAFFEQLVVELIVKMGYGGNIKEAREVIGKTGDGGIDGVIKQDRLGLDKIYIQAKRWSDNVGRPSIQAFVGALVGVQAKKGIYITTSKFTEQAIQYVQNLEHKVVLINGTQLAEYMIEFNLGVSSEKEFVIKSIDNDYFEKV